MKVVAFTSMGPGMKEGSKKTRKNPLYPDLAGKLQKLIPAQQWFKAAKKQEVK
jgi:hypothetical protein